jgi:ankyrin repeat protein
MSGLDRGQTISSLGELIDMYHTHEATKVHDKVYALLGMSSDDFSKAGLSPDYGVSWEEILQRLVKYLLGEALLVETSCKREVALIKCKGFVLGKVVSVQRNSDKQDVDVDLEKYIRQRAGYPKGTSSVRWTLAISAKPIQYEDVICYVQGAPGPTIIRPCKDHFSIIKIATFPLNEVKRVDWKTFKAVTCDLHLVWDWGNPRERLQDYGIYESSMRKTNSIWEHPKTEPEFRLGEAIRTGNIASILTKLGLINAAKWGENAIEGYDIAFGKSSTKTTYTYTGHSPLLWAAYNGYDEIVNLLITKYGVDPDTKDSRLGQTSLSWAVMAGQKSVVKLLLSMDKVDADSRNYSGFTPLLYAAITGEEAIVKLLLQTNKVNVNSSSQDGGTQLSLAGTPLSLAIENGHEGVVKLLLDTGNVDVESTNKSGETPLSLAAKTGDEAVVKLLLDTRKVDVGSRDEWGRTPLSVAAQNGHEAIVKLLLGIEEVDVNSEDIWGITPLSVAANRGYKSIIKLLLNTEKVEVESKDRMGRTPLSHAAEQGYESVIELLLDTGKVNVNIVDKWVAETKGHIAVVELFDKRLHE